MAAGASSPELFSSIIALFVTHSSLGLGTIVGSEIFNQLIICAGAVFSAKSGKLQLDQAIVTREVGFYALSIALLYLALHDTAPDPTDPSGNDHIYISFWKACLLLAGYVAYVIVCANMDAIVAFCNGCCSCCRRQEEYQVLTKRTSEARYGTSTRISLNHVGHMPYIVDPDLVREPKGNFEPVEYYRTITGERAPSLHNLEQTSSFEADGSATDPSLNDHSLTSSFQKAIGRYSDGQEVRKFRFLIKADKPSEENGIYDMEINSVRSSVRWVGSCLLSQRY